TTLTENEILAEKGHKLYGATLIGWIVRENRVYQERFPLILEKTAGLAALLRTAALPCKRQV
ncbi:MAG: hypothetical protein II368_06695, partial [Clostridia bacterium]|nr:hypothetical protein [Clostridia bacterium]